eukprot:gene10187-biopygen7116
MNRSLSCPGVPSNRFLGKERADGWEQGAPYNRLGIPILQRVPQWGLCHSGRCRSGQSSLCGNTVAVAVTSLAANGKVAAAVPPCR